MVQVSFLNLIGRPTGQTIKQTLHYYNRSCGRPNEKMTNSIMLACKEVLEVSSWRQFFPRIGVPPLSAERVTSFLKEAIINSLNKGYHGRKGGRQQEVLPPWRMPPFISPLSSTNLLPPLLSVNGLYPYQSPTYRLPYSGISERSVSLSKPKPNLSVTIPLQPSKPSAPFSNQNHPPTNPVLSIQQSASSMNPLQPIHLSTNGLTQSKPLQPVGQRTSALPSNPNPNPSPNNPLKPAGRSTLIPLQPSGLSAPLSPPVSAWSRPLDLSMFAHTAHMASPVYKSPPLPSQPQYPSNRNIDTGYRSGRDPNRTQRVDRGRGKGRNK